MIDFRGIGVWNDCPVCGAAMKYETFSIDGKLMYASLVGCDGHYKIVFETGMIAYDEFTLDEQYTFNRVRVGRSKSGTSISGVIGFGIAFANVKRLIPFDRFNSFEKARKLLRMYAVLQ